MDAPLTAIYGRRFLGKRVLILAAAGFGALLSVSGHRAFADDGNGDATQAALIQAEGQADVARSTAAAAAALDSLAQGPVHPLAVSAPAGVVVAAPAAPVRAALPPIDYSKLPPDLARPVTIKWDGPVDGAIAAVAQQINYTVIPSPRQAASPPNILLDEKGVPAAALFQKIGAQVAQYGVVSLNPNKRTVQLIIKPTH